MIISEIPDTQSSYTLADWVELFVTSNQEDISKSRVRSFIEQQSGTDPSDSDIDNIWLELENRQFLYGENPPYTVNRDLIVHNLDWNECPEYLTCLIFSLYGNQSDSVTGGRIFEKISNEAIRNFIGGKSIIFGAPNEITVEELAKELQEKFITEFPSERRDRNLDIVAWKPFGDNRSSQIIILIQCAAGHNWKGKLKELSLDAWTKYIHFACTPIRGFSLPLILSNSSDLFEISIDAGLILDRSRIYRNSLEETPSDNFREELKTWCLSRLEEIKN